jgi:hypothetical protein
MSTIDDMQNLDDGEAEADEHPIGSELGKRLAPLSAGAPQHEGEQS